MGQAGPEGGGRQADQAHGLDIRDAPAEEGRSGAVGEYPQPLLGLRHHEDARRREGEGQVARLQLARGQ
eukprot:9076906-Alexandrium_andersonii.AAC.1